MPRRSLQIIASFLFLAFVFAVGLLRNSAAGPQKQSAETKVEKIDYNREISPILAKYCTKCHGGEKPRGGLALDKFKTGDEAKKHPKVWEQVVENLSGGLMPPKGRAKPSPAEFAKIAAWLQYIRPDIDCTKAQNPGRVTLRRLNRNEYNNTIRDLVGIANFRPAADFPPDDVGYGFDNIGDVLTMSPLLLEKYLAAAETIVNKAIVNVDLPKPKKTRLGGLRVTRDAGELRFGGGYLTSRGAVYGVTDLDAGEYVIRAEVYGDETEKQPIQAAIRVGYFSDVKKFDVKGGRSESVTLEAKTRLRKGSNRIGVMFLNPSEDKKRRLYVRRIEIEGPFNPPPPKLPEIHERIMAHKKGLPKRDAAREIIGRFATLAFRRPLVAGELDNLMRLYDKAEKAGDRYENRIRMVMMRILISPHFLFRVEPDPADAVAGKAYPINEYALASRLSYFLWSTMPDEELFRLAGKKELRQNLVPQIQRMLKDKKSNALVKNFAGQWLTLRKLDNVSPDRKTFPRFDKDLREAMRRETELFFEAMLREDRNILEFLDADFSFVNERLARHYGIDGVRGDDFRKVKMPANRRGILTHASILTLTSFPTRTSPVNRGKWVLDQILNTPPPPPPPDVPELSEEKQLKGSLREVMEMHRKNTLCAACHQRMDPIGFAFENFNAVGAWRDKDGRFPIDPAGELPDGQTFQGPTGLIAILKKKRELFARCLTEKMLTYALGRGLEYYDKCAVDRVLGVLEKNDFRFSSLIIEVAKSEPFQKRMATKRGQ